MSPRANICVLLGLLWLPIASWSAPALDIDGLSPSVAPCTDFDRFVNGKWESSAVMPAHKARIGSFDGCGTRAAELSKKRWLKQSANRSGWTRRASDSLPSITRAAWTWRRSKSAGSLRCHLCCAD